MNKKRGFTTVELAVTIGVLALTLSILIVYSRTGEQQILLFREQAKIINIMLRAKSLALNTFFEEGAPCGYGAHIDAATNEVRIFRDLDDAESNVNCGAADNTYNAGTLEDMGPLFTEQIDPGVAISLAESPETNFNIVFIPPNPDVVITPDPSPAFESVIELTLPDGTSKNIKVNRFGQVSVE